MKLEGHSWFNDEYCFFDTEDYLANRLFAKYKLKVKFKEELTKPGFPYKICFCKVKKKDSEKFLKCMLELIDLMILNGHTRYKEEIKELFDEVDIILNKEVQDS